MTGALNIDICVCTFRREHIADTLRSLSTLLLQPTWGIHVIVADNDDTPSARALVETTARVCNLSVTYLHAPARNISIARNACLNKATGDLFAFIDDDELVTPEWLEAMINTYQMKNADVVLGPVRAVYEEYHPKWLREGDFHSLKPVWIQGKIMTGYAGNVLFNRTAKSIKGLRFRGDLGRTGGEDTFFFSTIHKAGGYIVYSPEAIITEAVPSNRASFKWLLRRRYRFGQTHGRLLRETTASGFLQRLKYVTMAYAKLFFCLCISLLNIFNDQRRRFWLLRGMLHAGVGASMLGVKTIEPYS